MNRNIKIRGKSIENYEQIYGDLKHNETYSICYDKNDVYFEVDDKTVGQFTGLLDINCKEIFTGLSEKLKEQLEEDEHGLAMSGYMYSYPDWFVRKKGAYTALRDALSKCSEFIDDIKRVL